MALALQKKMEYRLFRRWAAYQKAFETANTIFLVSKKFPSEEKYALTDQIRRSSRAVCGNLAEAYGKRRYPKHFIAKITDAASENAETQAWLDFALNSSYLSQEEYSNLLSLAEEVGRLLHYMEFNPHRFTLK